MQNKPAVELGIIIITTSHLKIHTTRDYFTAEKWHSAILLVFVETSNQDHGILELRELKNTKMIRSQVFFITNVSHLGSF